MDIQTLIDRQKKRPWRRRVVSNAPGSISGTPVSSFRIMTQDDFLNEVCPAAHPINAPEMSRRPIYGPTGKKNAKGQEQWDIVGYDDVETVSIGKQEGIINKKVAHFAADGFWISSENAKDESRYETLMSWADTLGLKTAFIAAVKAAFRTGDSAIYLYQTGEKKLDYEVFDYEHGSELFPHQTFDGKKSLVRKYKFENHSAVDIFTTETIETWMMLSDSGDEDIIPISQRIEKSDDGYTLVRRTQAQVGDDLCQCAYFRVDDIPTGPAQLSIEKLENAKTYVGEHLKGSAMPILFIKSEKTTSLPPNEFANKVIGVKGTTDSLSQSDAKYLSPADASNIADLHIDGLEDDIKDTCMSVTIDPEIIKQGSDSSATMQILYEPEVQWATIHWPEFFKPVKELVEVFKILVGKVENDVTGYSEMRLSVGQNIYIPRNKAESLKMELDQVYARTKSRQAAIQDIGNTHKGDYEKINKEWEEELTMKAEIPAKAKAEFGETSDTVGANDDDRNPSKTPVDNNSKGKTIQE